MQNFMGADQEVLWVRFPVDAVSTEGRGAAHNYVWVLIPSCLNLAPNRAIKGQMCGALSMEDCT